MSRYEEAKKIYSALGIDTEKSVKQIFVITVTLKQSSIRFFLIRCKRERDRLIGLIIGHSSDPFFLSSDKLVLIVYLKI